jgi:uncharacterized protein YndB with AHSA1/START domain
MDGNTVSVERVINASPDKIFALLTDAGKHASFDGSDSVNHASQASVPLSMGSRFGMAMRGRKEALFIPYRTNNTVIEYGAGPPHRMEDHRTGRSVGRPHLALRAERGRGRDAGA